MKKIEKIIIALICIGAVPFIIWNLTFGFLIGYLLSIIFTLGLYHSIKRQSIKPVFIGIFAGFILYMIMLPLTAGTLARVQDEFQSRIDKGQHLNLIEKWNIYGLNITGSVTSILVFPEVSIEALLMMFPDSDEKRTFKGDFFMESPKMLKAFKQSNKGRVRWYAKDYVSPSEARTSLALNICDYEIISDGNRKIYVAEANVEYPVKSRIALKMPYIPVHIIVQEGLFRYLTDQGWLFRYRAIWKHEIHK